MKKQEQLKREVSYIRNPKYRENANRLIELLPDYFFEVGFEHPPFLLLTAQVIPLEMVALFVM